MAVVALMVTSLGSLAPTQAAVIPSAARYVSTTGSDGNSGRITSPFATIGRAISAAGNGDTIVVRAGTYHESLTIPAGRSLTLEGYPGETVWLDGTSAVSGWTSVNGVWRHDNWTAQFDSSPSFTAGQPDGTAAAWQWLSRAYPMAAHPDGVWIDDLQQAQVSTLSEVEPGTFYVDYANKKLYVGTNPTTSTVRASTLSRAIYLAGANSTIANLGVRRYATSIPLMGAVVVTGKGATLSGLYVSENASTGIGVFSSGVSISDVTVERSGLVGIAANTADGLTLTRVRSLSNNAQHFNQAPVSGGIKLARSRGIVIRDSQASGNDGPGIWADASVFNVRISHSMVQNNAGYGIFLEISSTAVVAGNLITKNARDGIKINNMSNVQIWNNTFAGNARSINIVQDSRSGSTRSDYGHDFRQPFPDPTMTWLVSRVVIVDNVITSQNDAGNCMLCVEDYTHTRSAAQMGVNSGSNLFSRTASASPSWLVVWARSGGQNPAVYTDLSSYSNATGMDARSKLIVGVSAVTANFSLTPGAAALESAIAWPISSDLAGLVGAPAGARVIGYQG